MGVTGLPVEKLQGWLIRGCNDISLMNLLWHSSLDLSNLDIGNSPNIIMEAVSFEEVDSWNDDIASICGNFIHKFSTILDSAPGLHRVLPPSTHSRFSILCI